jgi:methylenetetrahydrofolate--tRNA-(uracil-5-)-methyltransferase
MIRIIGGGLAGSEAAWQAATQGVPVTLYEMRPVCPTAVHKTDRLAELVCSNSFRGDKLDNAVGLLKEEMRRLGSLVMRAAENNRVPAGAALAVDREGFAEEITRAIAGHPLITTVREEVASIPDSSDDHPVIVATGPLTSDALSADIARLVGTGHLYFYDAISPIVLAESIDTGKFNRCRRRGLPELPADARGLSDLLRRADPRRVGHASRFRQGTLLRGLSAHRGNGPSRR